MASEKISVDLPKTTSRVFAHTRWDVIPVLCGFLHLAFFLSLFYLFPRTPLWIMVCLGLVYAVSISWNINGIAHNFIHHPYFRSTTLNRLFSLLESLVCCFSQVHYDVVHTRHHKGNSDRKDENGDTVDWLSIYRHGHDDEAENPWTYIFLGFIRDSPKSFGAELAKRGPKEVFWGRVEITSVVGFLILMGIFNWKCVVLFYLPCMYLGQCLSNLNGYYLHYGANPDKPIAWGVSSYAKLYNWTWFYNGYHAEHHFRPNVHWTKMVALHEVIKDAQQREGVRVITPPHALGFLDPTLPPLSGTRAGSAVVGESAPSAA